MKKLISAAAVAAALLAAQPVVADQNLATAKGCMACHKLDAKLVGPGYQEVAAKYKGDAEAPAKLAAKVVAGGSGVWGPIPMPPKGGRADLTDADIQTLVAWILSL